MTRKSPFHLGLRREVLILLPLATLLLVLLITFVLFSFRNGLDLLIDQRQDSIPERFYSGPRLLQPRPLFCWEQELTFEQRSLGVGLAKHRATSAKLKDDRIYLASRRAPNASFEQLSRES